VTERFGPSQLDGNCAAVEPGQRRRRAGALCVDPRVDELFSGHGLARRQSIWRARSISGPSTRNVSEDSGRSTSSV